MSVVVCGLGLTEGWARRSVLVFVGERAGGVGGVRDPERDGLSRPGLTFWYWGGGLQPPGLLLLRGRRAEERRNSCKLGDGLKSRPPFPSKAEEG